MRNNTLLAATAAALLAGTAVGHADTLAGGPLPLASSSGIALVTCALFNAGSTAVPLTSAAIVGLNGQPLRLLNPTTISPQCGTSIPAGQGCVIQAVASTASFPNSSYTCVTTTTGSDAFVRGSLAIGLSGGAPAIVAVPLQATAASPGGGPP